MALRAVGVYVDARGVDARAQQPQAVDRLQVDVVFVAALFDALVHRGVEQGEKGVGHVTVGLKAALADARTDGGAQCVGIGAVAAHHRHGGLERDAARRTAPAGVHRTDRTRSRVVERDDATVRPVGEQRQVRHVRDEPVGVVGTVIPENFARVLFRCNADKVRVDLAAADGAARVKAYGLAETAVVFE